MHPNLLHIYTFNFSTSPWLISQACQKWFRIVGIQSNIFSFPRSLATWEGNFEINFLSRNISLNFNCDLNECTLSTFLTISSFYILLALPLWYGALFSSVMTLLQYLLLYFVVLFFFKLLNLIWWSPGESWIWNYMWTPFNGFFLRQSIAEYQKYKLNPMPEVAKEILPPPLPKAFSWSKHIKESLEFEWMVWSLFHNAMCEYSHCIITNTRLNCSTFFSCQNIV